MVLGTYKHYKGNIYRVIGVAQHTESREEFVVYHSLDDDKTLWARPQKMFVEDVEVDGKHIPRFKLIREQ
jgi:hypothetical protein